MSDQTLPLSDLHLTLGAALDDAGQPQRYRDLDAEVSAVRQGAGLFDLSAAQTFHLRSPEARRWSNGMFTNNIRRLQPGQGNRSAMCDDRGRVQGLLDLYCLDDETFFGVLEGVDLAWFAGRYEMFLMLDDIELESHPDAPWLLSVQGPKAEAILAAASLPTPQNTRDHVEQDGLRVMRRDRTGLGGFDLLCADDAVLRHIWTTLLEAGAQPAGHQTLDALRILAGRARWPTDGTEKSMVHELRLNEEVCAFDKGCYVGQEVINRIDVKGAIQKRLTGLRLLERPPEGSPVFLGDKKIGTITSMVSLHGEIFGLGVLRKTAWEPGTTVAVRPEGSDPISATVADLPMSAG
ncbi:MAG: glycine cleavage T C-terminal barrel domain-containing protein [Myxococcota bacterium]